MSAGTTEYELVLMLDPEAPDERRDQIAADARTRIEAGGNLKSDSAWGMRKLAYEIRQRTEADYRYFRFETGGTLLDDLNHNLKIADGVLRFRIFKVDSRSPVIVPPPPTPLSSGAPGRGGRRGDGRDRRGDGRGPRGERAAREGQAASPAAPPAAEPTSAETQPTSPAEGGTESAAPASSGQTAPEPPAAPDDAPSLDQPATGGEQRS